jgi:hypothetical protein
MVTLTHLKCSIPGCFNTVGQHCKRTNKNKQVCAAHRTHRKHEVDKWKMDAGCANKDGHYGFKCVCSTILDPCTLEINHIDGNNDNRDPSNIEVLCGMCHPLVTKIQGHSKKLNQNKKRRLQPSPDTGLFSGLFS